MTSPQMDTSWQQARHLLARAGFGGRRQEIDRWTGLRQEERVTELLAGPSSIACTRPVWLDQSDRQAANRMASREERQEEQIQNREWTRDLIQTWLHSMVAAPDPAGMLRLKMTFFWHGHFATHMQKVKSAGRIWRQLDLFHREAIGNFGTLLQGIVQDPAMLIYLDNVRSHRNAPNENLSRELMELFSLGNGAYTEADIREGARALTGNSIEGNAFRFRPFMHDSGDKTILGQAGIDRAADFVDCILQQPACARFVTAKLWRFFAGETASSAPIEELASVFRHSSYDVKPLLQAIFSHADFHGDGIMGNQIKSPLQLVVGTLRTTQLDGLPEGAMMRLMGQMGQMPYQPPNVKGWPDGRAWIDTSRLLIRMAMAELIQARQLPRNMQRMMMARNVATLRLQPDGLVDTHASPSQQVEQACAVLLPIRPPRELLDDLTERLRTELQAESADAYRLLCGTLMLLPQYQLT